MPLLNRPTLAQTASYFTRLNVTFSRHKMKTICGDAPVRPMRLSDVGDHLGTIRRNELRKWTFASSCVARRFALGASAGGVISFRRRCLWISRQLVPQESGRSPGHFPDTFRGVLRQIGGPRCRDHDIATEGNVSVATGTERI